MAEPKQYRLRYAAYNTTTDQNHPLVNTSEKLPFWIKDPAGTVEQ